VTEALRLASRDAEATDRDEWEELVDRTPVPAGIGQRYDLSTVDGQEGIRSVFVTVRTGGGRLVGGARLTTTTRFPSRYVEMIDGPLFLPEYEDEVRALVARAIREKVTVVDSAMVRPSAGHPWRFDEFGLHRTGVPAETVRIDLRPTEESLWRAVDHSVRQGVRKAKDNGLAVREVTDEAELGRIYPLIDRFGRDRDFAIVSERRLRAMHRLLRPSGRWHVLVGESGSSAAGIALLWLSNQLSGLMVLGSAPEYAKAQLTSLLAWESIRTSKIYGASLFDFLGLPPKGSSLSGIRRFKLKWGGSVVGGEEYLEGVLFRYVTEFLRRHPSTFDSVIMARGPFRAGRR